MTVQTKSIILKQAKKLFATSGYEGFSMRILAKRSDVGLSSIYHFFGDKDEILEELFKTISKSLGTERAKLPKCSTASEMLRQRIEFQFKHIEEVVFVLKYYLHFRPEFIKLNSGYIPEKAYLHIDEVLRFGSSNGEFYIDEADIDKESKVIAHAINGFLLEYYPNTPKKSEFEDVVQSIHSFLLRSLTNKEVAMK